MKILLNTIALLALSIAAVELPASGRPVSNFQHLVRTETWVEKWPDTSGKIRARSVTAEIWTAAMQAALATSSSELNGNVRGSSAKEQPVFGTHGVILLHNVRRVSVKNITVRQLFLEWCPADGSSLPQVGLRPTETGNERLMMLDPQCPARPQSGNQCGTNPHSVGRIPTYSAPFSQSVTTTRANCRSAPSRDVQGDGSIGGVLDQARPKSETDR